MPVQDCCCEIIQRGMASTVGIGTFAGGEGALNVFEVRDRQEIFLLCY